MKFWLNLRCQWKSWKSVNTLSADSLQEHQAKDCHREREKPWRDASEWTSSAKPSRSAVGMSALHHKDPCSGLKPAGTYQLTTTEMRAERRKTERKRLFQKLYSHQQVFSALWKVSYHLRFLTQLELSTQPVRDDSLGLFPCSFTCLWHDLESCHSASCWVSGNGLGWSVTSARHFSRSVPKPPPACVLRLVTKHMQVLQGSHKSASAPPPKGFSFCFKSLPKPRSMVQAAQAPLPQEKGELR